MKLGLTFDDVLLVPQYSEISSRSLVDTSVNITNTYKLDIPIISANMDSITEYDMALTMFEHGGMGIIHRFMPIEKQCKIIKDLSDFGLANPAAAVGIHEEDKIRIQKLVDNGASIICLDIAHADNKSCLYMVEWTRNHYHSLDIIAGNVATGDGALRLHNAGANIIKCGVGGGSICVTRVISGHGIPQFTAIQDVFEALPHSVSIIADGGIRTSGDIVKALAAGAASVMLGNLLSGTDETPGEIVNIGGKLYKSYRGMASKSANESRRKLDTAISNSFNSTPEGVEALVPYKGHVEKILTDLVGGIRSGLSYSGAMNISELQENAEFIQITNAGIRESNYHDVELVNKGD